MAILAMLRHRFYKNDGSLNSGGKVWTYLAGTTTPTSTYTTSAADVANTNPIILNSKGECDLWVSGQIKVNVLESDDTQVTGWPVDNVGSGVSNNDANARWAGTAAGSANALEISPSPAISAYAVGQSFIFKSGASANTTATTIAISGLSAIAVQSNGAACSGGEILANNWYQIVLSTAAICQISKIGEPTLAELGLSFGSGVSTFLATPSSANLLAAVTDETGTGSLVFATSPTLVTPALGTPSSGVVTNLTGTASININGTVGATTPTTVAATTGAFSGNITQTGGTIKGFSTISVGNATPSASGAGITFPATQSASTDPNTFDDYEEGTWTPTQGAGLTVVGAFSSTGTYTKTGRQVTILGTVSGATSVAVAANVQICGGVPFSAAGGPPYGYGTTANGTNTVNKACYIFTTSAYSVEAQAASTTIYFSATYFV